MRRFAFRLENVLRLRKKLEEGVQREFSRALALLLDAKEELDNSAARLRRAYDENRMDAGVFTASEFVAMDNYVALLKREIARLSAAAREREEEVERVRNLLHEAKKATKIMENLRRRSFERYLDELNREETLELDDVNQKIGLNRERLTAEDFMIEEM